MANEKKFENKVKRYLDNIPGCWYYKHWGGGFSKSGIPDLICCVNGVFIAVELKAEAGKATELQKINIRKINAAGGIGLILYPAGFDTFKKLVEEVLRCSSPTAGLSALKNVRNSSISGILKD